MKTCAAICLQLLLTIAIIAMAAIGLLFIPSGEPWRPVGFRSLAMAFLLAGLAGVYSTRHRPEYVGDLTWLSFRVSTVGMFVISAALLLVSFF